MGRRTEKDHRAKDLQALHRIRAQLIKWRTALANETRGLLAEPTLQDLILLRT